MILCVDTRVLKTSPHVQKDVNLEDIQQSLLDEDGINLTR